MPGYDVSTPSSGEPIEGWALTKAAIDLSHGNRDGVFPPFVAADMKIIAPKSLYVSSTNESDYGAPVVDVHRLGFLRMAMVSHLLR
ncbi:hypothetical protein CSUB01_11023 [Colletotrichum sublineola]|uniref:Uncharacterized protein n=1 Tax=Colletotrichum sublineola TaxID=1173701 RepID=A0A066XYH9_COLSU|nr:hypothetical protein CSUB01_11023 [Colletotrichum sublineola]